MPVICDLLFETLFEQCPSRKYYAATPTFLTIIQYHSFDTKKLEYKISPKFSEGAESSTPASRIGVSDAEDIVPKVNLKTGHARIILLCIWLAA